MLVVRELQSIDCFSIIYKAIEQSQYKSNWFWALSFLKCIGCYKAGVNENTAVVHAVILYNWLVWYLHNWRI